MARRAPRRPRPLGLNANAPSLHRRLAERESTIPRNASHQVGVGAIVLNARGEILVVQEKNGPLKGQGVWKMPTGIVHQGEELW